MDVKIIDQDLLDHTSKNAKSSNRKRKNFNFHELEDPAQRMLNAIEPDSYVRPHRHLSPPRDETFLILQGLGAVILFQEDGRFKDTILLDPTTKKFGVDLPPGCIHSIISFVANTVFFEVKPGPYRTENDKNFMDWSPEEGTEAANAYLNTLKNEAKSFIQKKYGIDIKV